VGSEGGRRKEEGWWVVGERGGEGRGFMMVRMDFISFFDGVCMCLEKIIYSHRWLVGS
jgi:hypothetical protein